MNTVVQDLRYGLRMLAKNPGFTAVAAVTLALGIGANTAMFSVVYSVLLRPLPYPQADRMVEISVTYRGELQGYSGFTASAFDFWQGHRRPFQYLAAFTHVGFNLTGAGRPEHLGALRVSSEYFNVYGVPPFLGRDFSRDEETVGGPQVAVLSYELWREHFYGDPRAVGRSILLDGAPYTVIGVMPVGFASIPPAALWTTIGQVQDTIGSGQNYAVIGKLEAGASLRQADAYLSGVAPTFAGQFYQWVPERDRKAVSFVAAPYRYVISSEVRAPLLALFGAIGFVLLIACVNVANLLLARSAGRNREIALRTAMGAGRGRIFRQLLTESVLLALFGAALGLLTAFWGLHSLLALAPDALPRAQQISLNGWALIFTAGVAVLTGIVLGLAPALRASHVNLNESLKEAEGWATLSLRRQRLSAVMVCTEVGLSLVLLIGSGLLIRTFASLLSIDPGLDPHDMLTLQIWTTGSKYDSTPALANFYQELVNHIEAIPGVKSAAVVAAGLPLERGGNLNPGVRVRGHLEFPSVDYREVTPGYFRTLGVPLLAGRFLTSADSPTSSKVAIINAAFARQYFPGQDAVGQHLVLDHADLEIVGVTGDVRSSLNEPAPPTFFIPTAQASYDTDRLFQGWFPVSVLVRTAVQALTLSRAVENTVRDADPSIPVGHVRSMEEVLSISLALERFLMTLMSAFAGLGLLLAVVGIYGVLSYSLAQRRRELGVRMALGAASHDVLRMVLWEGAILGVIGMAAGLAAALGLTRLITSVLYGVRPTDPPTFAVVSLVLAGAVLLASYIPARRATKVDPMVALRYE